MRTLCFAVKHIHDAGVVHRDLRPENILFRTPDEAAPVMVAGFGLSRIVDDAPYPRSLTFTAGYALQYTAPEMISEGSLPVLYCGFAWLTSRCSGTKQACGRVELGHSGVFHNRRLRPVRALRAERNGGTGREG